MTPYKAKLVSVAANTMVREHLKANYNFDDIATKVVEAQFAVGHERIKSRKDEKINLPDLRKRNRNFNRMPECRTN